DALAAPLWRPLGSSFLRAGARRGLHSFPTRRSSDLRRPRRAAGGRRISGRIDVIVVPHAAILARVAAEHADFRQVGRHIAQVPEDRKSTRLNSSHVKSSYAVFWLKKKTPC